MEKENRRRQVRGFAAMSEEKQRDISSLGGKACHQKGTAHKWNSEQAREAGRKGGLNSHGGKGKNFIPQNPSLTR